MYRIVIAIVLTVSVTLPASADESQNIQVVKAMATTINDRNLDALDDFVTTDVVRHSGATPGVVVTNISEFRAFLETDFATVPDSVQEIDIIFGGGDYVAMRARYIGTQTGPMGPFPASNKRLELPFIGILRLESGKVAEIWVEWDNLNALTQLGHFPPPE